MNKLTDKLLVFFFCLIFYMQYHHNPYMIVPVIIAITCSALNSLPANGFAGLICFLAYSLAGIFFPPLTFFIPLIGYDVLLSRWQFGIFLAAIPLTVNFSGISPGFTWMVVIVLVLAWFMKYRTAGMEKARQEAIEIRDYTKELSLHLEQKNRELMERQDYEVNLATLQERNRIAREIHDNVGHLLSSSILQIGAMMTLCRDEEIKGGLKNLKDTLSEGMNSIRSSIHELHDESLDLYNEVYSLINNFKFCPVMLEYDMDGNPDRIIKYAFIAIIKEALANIIKHSDASQVTVTLREHPGFYQLIIKDNGSQKPLTADSGMGLNNIRDRVSSLNGYINISSENGFVIFISVPREDSYENNNRG